MLRAWFTRRQYSLTEALSVPTCSTHKAPHWVNAAHVGILWGGRTPETPETPETWLHACILRSCKIQFNEYKTVVVCVGEGVIL